MSKFAKPTGLLWPKVSLTVHRTPFGKHKLTPQERVTGRPTSVGIRPSADPLSHASVISYCKSPTSYAQASRQRFKEAFPVPIQRILLLSLEPHDRVFWKLHQRKTALDVGGSDLTKCSTDTAAKLEGTEPWVHISQLRRSHLTSGPVQTLGTSGSNRQGEAAAATQDAGSRFHTLIKTQNPFLFFPLLWH